MAQDEGNGAFSERQASSATSPTAVATSKSGAMPCPRCGGTRILRRTHPLLWSMAACVLSAVLMPVFCPMALAAMIAFLSLPVAAAFALFGRHRCLDCRHRFGPPCDTPVPGTKSFPFGLHLLNALLILLLCFVGPTLIRTTGGAKWPDLSALSLGMACILLAWVSLVYHLVVHSLLRRRTANALVWTILFILPALAVGGLHSYMSLPRVEAASLLRFAKLAPLPRLATGVKAYSWSAVFSGEDYLCFTAEPNDIEHFLAASPALRGKEPTRYSLRKMRLERPKGRENEFSSGDANEYIILRPNTPGWYQQEVRGPARKYEVQPPRYQYPGEVLIDDTTHTVYVHLIFS